MHHSLVFFTVLCQTSIGAFIFRELLFFRANDDLKTGPKGSSILKTILGLLFVSLCIAFFHLGNPKNFINALNNLKSSWLSREVFFLCILIASLIIYLLIEKFRIKNWLKMLISAFSLLISGLLLFSMIKLYMLPSVVSWNNPFTPAGFVLTSIICGLALVTATLTKRKTTAKIVEPVLIAFLFISIILSILYNSLPFKQLPLLLIIRILLSTSAIIVLVIINRVINPNKNGIWPVILFLIVLSSEVINRYIFFLSFEKSGL